LLIRLADAKVVASGDVEIGIIPLSGPALGAMPLNTPSRGRLRFKATVLGTLKFRYLQRDLKTEYEENPADVAVLAADEIVVEFPTLWGEPALKVIYNSVGGTVNFADWVAVVDA
jgi:hypothetical protein